MAKSGTMVLLGFEDEPITEKHKGQLNFTVNKIGGLPDYPSNLKLDPPKCPLCQLPRLLVVQIYAPLENSVFHRTLYLFACINPNCWNSNESWICVRIQSEEKVTLDEASKTGTPNDWCADADDWDDDEDNNANLNEENGNVVRASDEEEESCSLEDSLRSGFVSLTMDNDKNANLGAQGGAVGRLHSPAATAEIEGNEGEAISIDTPTLPQRDINALLQEVAPLPQEICQRSPSSLVHFAPYFMSVHEETTDKHVNDRHVKELLQEYQQRNQQQEYQQGKGGDEAAPKGAEGYEKSDPAHGDKMFHAFLSRVQANRGQLLRFSRESSPLLLHRLQELPRCANCQGETVFEFQLVPTIISKLKLITDPKPCNRLEFGTVLVYTCRRSCWGTGDDGVGAPLRLESVIVQAESL